MRRVGGDIEVTIDARRFQRFGIRFGIAPASASAIEFTAAVTDEDQLASHDPGFGRDNAELAPAFRVDLRIFLAGLVGRCGFSWAATMLIESIAASAKRDGFVFIRFI
jgi:hypothetical protein